MNIEKNTVVQFHYHLHDDVGTEIENSRSGDPMAYLHGHNNMIVGLEEALLGKAVGDVFSVTVAPEKAYGELNADTKQRIPIKHIIGGKKPKLGEIISVQTEQGARQVTVEKVGRFNVDVDLNHPLAGKTLVFDVEILDVRQASDEEVGHGHAHGVGGHQH